VRFSENGCVSKFAVILSFCKTQDGVGFLGGEVWLAYYFNRIKHRYNFIYHFWFGSSDRKQ